MVGGGHGITDNSIDKTGGKERELLVGEGHGINDNSIDKTGGKRESYWLEGAWHH